MQQIGVVVIRFTPGSFELNFEYLESFSSFSIFDFNVWCSLRHSNEPSRKGFSGKSIIVIKFKKFEE